MTAQASSDAASLALAERRRAWWGPVLDGATRIWAFPVLIVLVVVFSAIRPDAFLSPVNMRSIAVDAGAYLVIAVGMTYVITIGGIDLSVGSVLVFAGVVSTQAMVAVGGSVPVTLAVGLVTALGAGLAWGLVNGLVVSKGRVHPLIATLGSYSAAYGASLVLSGGQDLRGVPDVLVDDFGNGDALGLLPYTVVVALAVALVGAFVLTDTRFGRYTSAIGSNVEAARRAAVRVDRHIIKVYVLSGVLAGLAGFISLARFGTTTINGHQNDMLQAILAVVLGGTALAGGRGTVLGTVVGVLIPSVLASGFVILGVVPFWQQVAIGVSLVLVLLADEWRRRSRRQ